MYIVVKMALLNCCSIFIAFLAVVKAWAVDCLVSKEEWSQWLVKLRIAFIKGPQPIAYDRLGKSAEETKVLRYKELQIHKHFDRDGIGLTTEDWQALITYANKLNVQEEAAGVVRYAEQHEMRMKCLHTSIKMLGRWYEKLNEWENALEA
ncbi:hypothetical protein DICVIV_14250, partial [Dictyocaulus viviparus]